MTLDEAGKAAPKVMNHYDVGDIVLALFHNYADYEKAHGVEDALHLRVLEIIAQTCLDERCRKMAELAASTKNIPFARHCA